MLRLKLGSPRRTSERDATESGRDIARLTRLNEAYVQASLAGDAAWFQEHLTPDFTCIESDGSLLDRQAFLQRVSAEPLLVHYELEDVDIRQYDRVALVRATGAWTDRDGPSGTSRYTDVYVRTGDRWMVVSAQITRPLDRQ